MTMFFLRNRINKKEKGEGEEATREERRGLSFYNSELSVHEMTHHRLEKKTRRSKKGQKREKI